MAVWVDFGRLAYVSRDNLGCYRIYVYVKGKSGTVRVSGG